MIDNPEFEEGVHSVDKKNAKTEKQEKSKISIDKKKLVIYSEIMKPKFDEGLN